MCEAFVPTWVVLYFFAGALPFVPRIRMVIFSSSVPDVEDCSCWCYWLCHKLGSKAKICGKGGTKKLLRGFDKFEYRSP